MRAIESMVLGKVSAGPSISEGRSFISMGIFGEDGDGKEEDEDDKLVKELTEL